MPPLITAVLVLVGLVVLFGIGYYWNMKTKKPDGCQEMESDCKGCGIISCGHHPAHLDKEN